MGHFRVPQPLHENEVGAKVPTQMTVSLIWKTLHWGSFCKLGFWKLETVHLRGSFEESGRDMTQNV